MKFLKQCHDTKRTALLLAAALAGAALGGCSITRPEPAPTQTESQVPSSASQIIDGQTESASAYEEYQEKALKEQARFDEFTGEVFRDSLSGSLLSLHFVLEDPEDYGITDYACSMGDASLTALRENLMEMKATRSQCGTFDVSLLTEDQALTLEILQTYLDTELSIEGLELYATSLMPYTGIQAELPILLSEYSFSSKRDVEEYLELLASTDEYFDQLLTFEQERSQAGLFFSDTAVDHIIESCQPYLIDPEYHFLQSTFVTRLEDVPDLTQEEKDAYASQNLTTLTEHFVPAYQALTEGLAALKGTGQYEGGLANYPQGKEYYEYLVQSQTGTSYTSMNDLKNFIEKSLNDDLAAMSAIIRQRPEALDELDAAVFSLSDPTEILETLKAEIQEDFPEIPEHTYTVKTVPQELQNVLSPALCLVPPLDHYQENTILLNLDDPSGYVQSLYTTLAHEGYPGHLYQNVYFMSTDPDPIRCILSFNGYSEGWGLYVESLAYTFDNGMASDVAQLLMHNNSASVALDALLDFNINYNGWTRDQVYDYLAGYYDVENSDIVDQLYSLLTENPGYYMSYCVGRLEFLEMREKAEESLGDQFNAKEFHKFLLDIGPAPFTVIRGRLDAWLLTQNMK